MERRLYKATEAAAYLAITPDELYGLRLTFVRHGLRGKRWAKEDLDKFIDSRKVRA